MFSCAFSIDCKSKFQIMAEYSLHVDDDVFYKQVQIDYGKTEKDIDDDMIILKKWLETQKHFPEEPPIHAVRFALVATKFSIERTKEKIDMYYTMKNLMPEMFAKHALSPELIFQSKITYCIPLPKPTSSLHRVMYCRINPEYEPEQFDHELCVMHTNYVAEMILMEDKCYKYHFIFDLLGTKLGYATRFRPLVVKKIATLLEKVYANRVVSFYIVNCYPFMENIMNTLFLPFLPKKMRDRVKIHKNTDILLEDFDKSIIPSDVGGEEKSLKELHDLLLKKMEEYRPRFDKIMHMKVDESLRPTKLENDEVLGYYGNFKQISVD